MSSSKQNHSWSSLLLRSFFYSLGMALLWASPFIVLALIILVPGLIIYFTVTPSPDDQSPLFYFIGLVLIGQAITTSLFLGAIPGLFAGIFAPANEPLNPFLSKFFRKVSSQTFYVLLLSIPLSYLITYLFTPFLDWTLNIITSSYTQFPFWYLFCGLGYCLGIYRAIRNASKATQAPKID